MSLPSSMADFVPCDRLLQKAYSKPNHLLAGFGPFNLNERGEISNLLRVESKLQIHVVFPVNVLLCLAMQVQYVIT